MSITKTSVTTPLKSMEMQQLREILEDEFHKCKLKTNLDSITDDSMSLIVKKTGYQTMLKIERLSHKPLEAAIEVDYNGASQDVIRQVKSDQDGQEGGFNQYRLIWMFIIFGGLIVTGISIIYSIIESITDNLLPDLTLEQQLFFTGLLFSVLFLGWLIIIPQIQKNRSQSLKKFDIEVLDIVLNRIEELNQELNSSDILRCWSCFKEIDPNDNICPYCGKKQK